MADAQRIALQGVQRMYRGAPGAHLKARAAPTALRAGGMTRRRRGSAELGEEFVNLFGGFRERALDGSGKAVARGDLLGFDADNEQAIGKFIEELRGGEEFAGVAFVRGTGAAGIGAAQFAEGHAMDGAGRRAGFHGIYDDEGFAAAEASEEREALRATIHELNLAFPALGGDGKVVEKGGADTVIAEKGVAKA